MEKNRVHTQSLTQLIWCPGNRSLCFGMRFGIRLFLKFDFLRRNTGGIICKLKNLRSTLGREEDSLVFKQKVLMKNAAKNPRQKQQMSRDSGVISHLKARHTLDGSYQSTFKHIWYDAWTIGGWNVFCCCNQIQVQQTQVSVIFSWFRFTYDLWLCINLLWSTGWLNHQWKNNWNSFEFQIQTS